MIRNTLFALLTIAFASCNTTDGSFLSEIKFESFSEEPYIVGKITNIGTRYIGEEPYLSILVEENRNIHDPLKPGGNKISFFLSDSTEILIQKRNGNTEKFPESRLKKNQIVGAWTDGVIQQSYPAQGGAERIVVIENRKMDSRFDLFLSD